MIFEDYDLDAKELGGTLSSMKESEKNGEAVILVGVFVLVGWLVGWCCNLVRTDRTVPF